MFLRSVLWGFLVIIGGCLGAFIYKLYIRKQLEQMSLDILAEVSEKQGYVTFLDGSFIMHCLDARAFSLLVDNLLNHYQADREM